MHDVCYTLTCRLSCFWAAKEYRGQDGKWHGEYKGTPETIRLRPFTLEEALIVQAFPDQFNIGRLRAVAREGIGNALPPPVMKQMLDFYQLSANSAPPARARARALLLVGGGRGAPGGASRRPRRCSLKVISRCAAAAQRADVMMLSERLATSDGGSRPRRFRRATYLCVPQRSKEFARRYSLAAQVELRSQQQ